MSLFVKTRVRRIQHFVTAFVDLERGWLMEVVLTGSAREVQALDNEETRKMQVFAL